MTRAFRRVTTTALATFAISALCGPGCGSRDESAPAGPDKLAQAQKARGASLKGEADGLIKTSRRR